MKRIRVLKRLRFLKRLCELIEGLKRLGDLSGLIDKRHDAEAIDTSAVAVVGNKNSRCDLWVVRQAQPHRSTMQEQEGRAAKSPSGKWTRRAAMARQCKCRPEQ